MCNFRVVKSQKMKSVSVIDGVYPQIKYCTCKSTITPEINSKLIQRCKCECNFGVINSSPNN